MPRQSYLRDLAEGAKDVSRKAEEFATKRNPPWWSILLMAVVVLVLQRALIVIF